VRVEHDPLQHLNQEEVESSCHQLRARSSYAANNTCPQYCG